MVNQENTSPLFSIVIPTYNRAHLILNTLKYVFAQTYSKFEVIIVDNKSTDNIVEVLQPLIDTGKVRFIQHDKNYERSKSRNTGMENAKGDFLTLLDSDDIIFPAFLEDAAAFVKDNPTIQFFHNRHNLIDEVGNLVYKYTFPAINDTPEHMVYGNYLSCNGVFLSKEIYNNYRLDESPGLIGSEDYEFWLRIAAKYKAGRIEKYNSAMVSHSGRSIVAFTLEETMAQQDYIINKFKQDEVLNNAYNPYYKKISASFCIYTAVLANQSGKYGKAIHYLKQAFAVEPSVLLQKRFLITLFNAIFKLG